MFRSLFVFLALMAWTASTPLFAVDQEAFFIQEDQAKEAFEDLTIRLLEKANLPPSTVVGILTPQIEGKVKDPKYLPLLQDSLEIILATRVKLADRSKLAQMEKEKVISLKHGKGAVVGVRIGLLKDIDYFLFARFSDAGKWGTHVKLTLTHVQTGILRAAASRTLEIPPVLQTPATMEANLFYDYQRRFDRAKTWRDRGYRAMTSSLWVMAAVIVGAPCQEKDTKDGKKYSNFVACNRTEGGPAYNAVATIGVFGILFGGGAYLTGEALMSGLEEERERTGLPKLTLAPVFQQGGTALVLTYRF